MNQMHKDHNEGFSVIQEAIGESKRKQEQALENVSLRPSQTVPTCWTNIAGHHVGQHVGVVCYGAQYVVEEKKRRN